MVIIKRAIKTMSTKKRPGDKYPQALKTGVLINGAVICGLVFPIKGAIVTTALQLALAYPIRKATQQYGTYK